jgi:hypothetical protein
MLEANVVASHTFDASSLTSCAPWLTVIACSRKGSQQARPVFPNRDIRFVTNI